MSSKKHFVSLSVFIVLAAFLLSARNLQAQDFTLKMLSSSIPTNLRGLCAVNQNVLWVCGNNGFVGKSNDGGTNWKWAKPTGYEASDFRDIEAFDENRVLVMASGTPAVILSTADGGKTWDEVFRSDDTAVFLDAMDFWDEREGVCIGDWTDGTPYALHTDNGGKTWNLIKNYNGKQKAFAEKTASFAASGTCVRTFNFNQQKGFALAIASGKKHGVLVVNFLDKDYGYEFIEAPYEASSQSQGLFSLCIDTATQSLFVAGGDYAQQTLGYVAFMKRNEKFIAPQSNVSGYRSCIETFTYNGQTLLIACGLNGADISPMGDIQWKMITQVPLNTAVKAKTGDAVFLCGPQGTIYKLGTK